MYPYRIEDTGETEDQEEVKWRQQRPVALKLQMEKILD
jgi:hypothetical protein